MMMQRNHTRRDAMALGLGGLLLPALRSHAAAAEAQPVLVELFTSQGCSSCPAADKLLGELAQKPGIMAVSFNVDYWDYLGWRDTLAKPEYSQRQYDYAKVRGDGQVYTPQLVVNGADHVVGSNASLVTGKIAKAPAPAIALQLNVTQTEITVSIPPQQFAGEATLWLMAIEPEARQTIERGENAGSEITYHNVVRNLVPAAMWKGEAYSGRWMRDAVMTEKASLCLAVLQRGKTGEVLGLARA